MFNKLFKKQETLEELIVKKPFDQALLEKKLSKLEYDKNDSTLLHLAAQNNCHDALNYLLKYGVNVNALNESNQNALFTALQNNAQECTKNILKYEIDLNQEDSNGNIPLHLAVKNGALNIIDSIASRTEDVSKTDRKGRNILFHAIESKDINVIKKVTALLDDIDLNTKDKDGNTIAHLKEITFDLDFLKDLVEDGLDISILNNKNEDFLFLNCLDLELDDDFMIFALDNGAVLDRKYTTKKIPLVSHITKELVSYDIQVYENKAIINAYQDRLLTFIEHDIDFNALDADDENLLFEVVRQKNELNLDFLLTRIDINVNQINKSGQTILDIAIFNGKPDMALIKRLLFTNIDSSLKVEDSFSVIEKLVDIILTESMVNRIRKIPRTRTYPNVNYTQILNLLLDYLKVDINTLTFADEPIIFEAARSFNVELLDTFKRQGINLDIVNKKDKLNVYYKVLEAGINARDLKQSFIKMLNYLVLNNVNIDHKDAYGGNVIHKAILDHDLAVINILTKRVGDYKAIDNKGRSYIHNTIWKDKVDILKKIALKNRSLINQADKFGILPINYAVIMGKKDVVFTLIKLGAFLNNQNKINEQFKENFFSKLGDLDDILNTSMTVNERNLMTRLVSNMKEEFKFNPEKED